jgi:hypothetical protein
MNDTFVNSEVVVPFINPWIEQPSKFTVNERGQIRTFE